jgi:hypothetical protein
MSAPKTVANWQADEVFLRSVTFPEEDRYLYTAAPWKGEFRWFRSPNVVPFERYKVSNDRRS